MTRKFKLLTGAAGVLLAATLAGIPSAFAGTKSYGNYGGGYGGNGSGYGGGYGGPHKFPRVHAEGASPSWYDARRQAVHNWRDKVANRYGYQYSRWFAAKDKDVDCKRIADDDPSWDDYGKRSLKKHDRPNYYEPVTRCHVSAIPSRGYFGWNRY